jgi:prepilin-type N-terminal cleavage/methylation domain-containing protein
MKIKIIKSNTGFTLIETLVSLAIFSVSIVALISVTASGVADTNFVKNKLTASYLAQEGVEMVRNIRDSNSLSLLGGNGIPWAPFTASVFSSCTPPNGCKIESSANSLVATICQVTNGYGCQLNYDSSGFYTYASSTASPFSRLITVQDALDGNNEVKVTSTVSWNQGSSPKSVTYSESLFDWIQ